ncbi:hypothetical protein GRX03_12660 [Halovenus sp. WSH3]|uniref:Uncharacterized protein n=1 Tax=Halovenus carboxidivorans TaxID=2692199 RepID=A0A6B0TA34_9EURY|nr:hypothetical protein [Halovenus carboxidivorans]
MESFRPFGVRSLITHAIMAITLVGALLSALVLEGELGQVSFVAFVNFTAGMWICQSIHALGNPQYEGVLSVVRNRGD